MVLNLVNPFVESDGTYIPFTISKFPDGQQTIDLTSPYPTLTPHNKVIIWSRMNSFRDVELIICATKAIRNVYPHTDVSLYVPYFIGARSDRMFQIGGVNYLKQVICPIINSLEFEEVVVIDPHSDVLEACLNNFSKFDWKLNVFHDWALTQIVGENINSFKNKEQLCLVSPDAGAYKKIFTVAKNFGIPKIITANKIRDLVSGRIIRTEIPTLDQHNDIKYVIVDDICDGGRTFVELAKVIKDSRPTAKIYLVVTHGIFSAGYSELNKYFSGIYCTNSYKDIGIKDLDGTITNVSQYDVFNTK